MSRALVTVLLIGLAGASLYAAEAFNAADTGTRSVTATVVGDSSAYLALSARTASPWNKFVSEDATTGLVSVSFAGPLTGGASGSGVNPKSIYYFDDILQLTNQGNATVYLQVVASASGSNGLKVCYETSVAAATCNNNAAYATTHPASASSLAVGSSAYLGLAVDSSAITSKATGTNTGTIRVYACRTASASCSAG
ncbi:MAG TPA: hypothetical protein VM370_11165 [Candidatus Thermoplasmatota archaeon]|nr:hypothetical protein [Candidatus Thermoplasmatota archaeon]